MNVCAIVDTHTHTRTQAFECSGTIVCSTFLVRKFARIKKAPTAIIRSLPILFGERTIVLE